MRMTRRVFMGASAATALSAAPRVFGASEEIRIAILGAGWRGGQLIPQFARIPGVRIVSVCDPDSSRAAEKAKQVEDVSGGRSAAVETDLRRVLADKSVDAVVIATPNHWHALAAIWACQAGKDVYVEKPVAHTLGESQQMVRAAAKYNRIVQGGTHRRSIENIRQIMSRIRRGEFGRVVRARALVHKLRQSIGRRSAPMKIPPEIDYNLWAGPAPMSPIYRNEFHYDWHWMWETGNGELANNGSHMLDLARWALGRETLAPAMISLGGRFLWNDAGQTPNLQVVYFDYQPAPLIAEIHNLPARPGARDAGDYRGVRHGIIIECEEAAISGSYDVEIRDRAGRLVEKSAGKETNQHPANFIAALRQRSPGALTCPIPTAHLSCGLALQGNISHRLGRLSSKPEALAAASSPQHRDAIDRMFAQLDALKIDPAQAAPSLGPLLAFDPQAYAFHGPHAKAANRLMRRPAYRPPFVMPETV